MRDIVAAIVDDGIEYPKTPPFHPDELYAELRELSIETGPPNSTYAAVRETFALLGLDKLNRDTSQWNPLSEIIKPGDTVVIKPNLVVHEGESTKGTQCLVTHGSVIRPIVDYCLLATGGNGRILVVDVPLQSADFDKLVTDNGLRDVVAYFREVRNADVSLVDMRPVRQVAEGEDFFFSATIEQEGDPLGYSVVDVSSRSWLEPLCKKGQPAFAVSDYDAGETRAHHTLGRHEYYLCNSILNADVFINVPKLKTHEKAGVTCNMKNIVGINGDKSWLPHFRKGSRQNGGDEWNNASFRKSLHSYVRGKLQGTHPLLWKSARFMWHRIRPAKSKENHVQYAQDLFEMGGAWYGNDTVWRMALDLNAIINFFSKDGTWKNERCRTYFFLVDGIVAGDGRGPLFPKPKHAGCLLAGFDQVAGDSVAAKLMGFDWEKIPLLRHAFDKESFALTPYDAPDEIKVATRDGLVLLRDFDINLDFEPAPGWKGMIELSEGAAVKR